MIWFRQSAYYYNLCLSNKENGSRVLTKSLMNKALMTKRTPKKELILAWLRSLEQISERSLFARSKSYSWIRIYIFQFQKIQKSQMSLGKSFLCKYPLYRIKYLISLNSITNCPFLIEVCKMEGLNWIDQTTKNARW